MQKKATELSSLKVESVLNNTNGIAFIIMRPYKREEINGVI
jgi:hypothetical protein